MRWLALAIPLLGACAVSPGEFHERVEAARSCGAEDACVFTEARDCICPAAVNASQASALNALLAKVDCGEVRSRCGELGTVQCVEGRCVAVKPTPKPAPQKLEVRPSRRRFERMTGPGFAEPRLLRPAELRPAERKPAPVAAEP